MHLHLHLHLCSRFKPGWRSGQQSPATRSSPLTVLPFSGGAFTFAGMPAPPHACYEILYVSQLAPQTPVRVIADIARQSRVANHARGITGMLVFDGSLFCEQIEGSEASVKALMARMALDSRHTDIHILHQGALAERRFRRFSMGYTHTPENALESLRQLTGKPALNAFVSMISGLDLDS